MTTHTDVQLVAERYTCVSTIHVTEKDMDLLTEEADPGTTKAELVVYDYAEGAWIYCAMRLADRLGHLLAAGFSKDFVKLLMLARAQGFTYLRLDADGEVYDDLPTHNW